MGFVPVIDISKIGLLVEEDSNVRTKDYNSVGEELHKALSTTGFAYLVNSGVTDLDITKLLKTYDKLFALDLDIKKQYNYAKNAAGYFGIGDENAGEYGGFEDYKEVFNLNGDALENPDYKWPDQHVPGMMDELKSFMGTCAKLSRRMCLVISHGMKLKDKEFLLKRHELLNRKGNHSVLRCNSYPPMPDDIWVKDKTRIGPHSDYGSFTFLFQDNTGGLQCKNVEGEFVDVKPIPDTIVMNIGDIMNLWTMGRLKSTMHRVIVPNKEIKNKKRHSIAYFIHPDDAVPIEEMEYESGADPPRPSELLFDPTTQDASKTAIEWAFQKFYKIHKIPGKWEPDAN